MYLNNEQVKTICDRLTRPDLESFNTEEFKALSYDQNKPIYYCPKGDKSRAFIYIRRSPNSKILAVAHTDIVRQKDIPIPKITYDRRWIQSRALDDRLGVWLILDYLPTILDLEEQPYDILLTDFEETGRSTAQFFLPKKEIQYNWMFQWDRHGDDLVMYDYETPQLKKMMEDFKFKVGIGSFSDICYLSHLNCAGFNIGTGYHQEHSDTCFCDLKETFSQVRKFIPFYSEWYHKQLKHNHEAAERKKKQRTTPYNYSSSGKGVIGYHANQHTGSSNYNFHRSLPPYDDSKKKMNTTGGTSTDLPRTIINRLKKNKGSISQAEIRNLEDEEYAIWCQFGDAEQRLGNTDAALLEAVALENEMRYYKEQVRLNKWSEREYKNWLQKVLKQQMYGEYIPKDVPQIPTNPSLSEYLKGSKKKGWDDLNDSQWKLAKEYMVDASMWEEYLYSPAVDISFEDYCIGRAVKDIPPCDRDPYDPSDSYFKSCKDKPSLITDTIEGDFTVLTDDDDTVLFEDYPTDNPSDKDLMDIEAKGIEELKKDPFYCSDSFPGGKEAQEQTLTDMT